MVTDLGYNTERLYDDNIVPKLGFYFHLTARLRINPSFFIIGVQKGGTTALCQYLYQHPEIIPSQRKDIYFFDNLLNYKKGINWYKSYFALGLYKRLYDKKYNVNSMTFDGTPDYFDVPGAPERLYKHYPNARLILLLRNPIHRAYSCYQMARKFGFETLSFEEALKLEEVRLQKESLYAPVHPYNSYVYQRLTYKKRGAYINYIKKWKELFGNNLLILKTEDMLSQTQQQMNKILDFLSLKPYDNFDFVQYNKGVYEKPINAGIYNELKEYYKPYNEQLYDYLNEDYGWQ